MTGRICAQGDLRPGSDAGLGLCTFLVCVNFETEGGMKEVGLVPGWGVLILRLNWHVDMWWEALSNLGRRVRLAVATGLWGSLASIMSSSEYHGSPSP